MIDTEFDKLFREIDTDNSGSISKDEMVSLINKFLFQQKPKDDLK